MGRKSKFPRTNIGRWETFWSLVDKTPGCWNWTGRIGRGGYGTFLLGGSHYAAHRLSAYWFCKVPNPRHEGPRTTGIVLHSCDNKRCVNPAHLRVGTAAENTADSYDRGLQVVPSGGKHHRAKLTDEQAADIRKQYAELAHNQYELATKYGVCQRTINKIVNNKSYPENA